MIYPRELFTEQEWGVLQDPRIHNTTAHCTLSDLQVEHGYESRGKFFAFFLFCRRQLDLWNCNRPSREASWCEARQVPGLWLATGDGTYVAPKEFQGEASGRYACLDL